MISPSGCNGTRAGILLSYVYATFARMVDAGCSRPGRSGQQNHY